MGRLLSQESSGGLNPCAPGALLSLTVRGAPRMGLQPFEVGSAGSRTARRTQWARGGGQRPLPLGHRCQPTLPGLLAGKGQESGSGRVRWVPSPTHTTQICADSHSTHTQVCTHVHTLHNTHVYTKHRYIYTHNMPHTHTCIHCTHRYTYAHIYTIHTKHMPTHNTSYTHVYTHLHRCAHSTYICTCIHNTHIYHIHTCAHTCTHIYTMHTAHTCTHIYTIQNRYAYMHHICTVHVCTLAHA